MTSKLDQAYEYYKSHKNDLLKKYEGKFIAIEDNAVIGCGTDKLEIIQNMIAKNHKLGDFLVQFVAGGEEVVHRFHSRVAL